MKFQKLLVLGAATTCLLIVAPGAAMAQEVNCVDGIIQNVTVDEINIAGRSCFISNTVVTGLITVSNSESLTMVGVEVGGNVQIVGGNLTILVSNTIHGNLVTNRNDKAVVLLNVVGLNALVNGNEKAQVKANVVAGTLRCRRNRRLDSTENEVGGTEICRGDDFLFDLF